MKTPLTYDDTWGLIYDANRAEVAACHSNKQDAAFIVRACNAHEQLIDFLFYAIPYIEEGEQFNKPTGKRLSKQVRKLLADLGELDKGGAYETRAQ